MSVRRPQRDCPLCDYRLPADTHAAIYHAYQENWRDVNCYKLVSRRAGKFGVDVTEAEARKHFQYHRIVQPAPRTRFKPEKALEQGRGLPVRLQETLILVSRVPALSGTQLAELFYWTGSESQIASARNACYRDLRRLVLDNFLYRWYPPVAAGPSGSAQRSQQLRNAFYTPGREAAPLIATAEGYEPVRGKDWALTESDLPSQHELFGQNAAAETVAALARKSKQLEAASKGVSVSGNTAYVRFVPMNWFAGRRVSVDLRDGKFQPGGLASFGVYLPMQTQRVSVGCPFLYEHDDGVRPLDKLAEHVLRYAELKRSGTLGQRFKQMKDLYPPVLVIARDPYRAEQLRLAAQAAARRRNLSAGLPIMVVCDQATVLGQPLDAEIWASMWDASPTPERRGLVEVLLRNWKASLDAGLAATTRLTLSPPKTALHTGEGE